jgi:hypothetical protein
MCNPSNVRIFEVLFSLALIAVGGWVLARARAGKNQSMYFGWQWITGKEANNASIFVAILLLALGIFVLLSAVFYLDC